MIGDKILRLIAKRIKASLRSNDSALCIRHLKNTWSNLSKAISVKISRYLISGMWTSRLSAIDLKTPTKHNKDRSDASVNRCMASLRHMLGKSCWMGNDQTESLWNGPKLVFKVNNERVRYLFKDEIDRLLAECSRQLIDLSAKNSKARSVKR